MHNANTMPSWPSRVFWHLYVVHVSQTCVEQRGLENKLNIKTTYKELSAHLIQIYLDGLI